MTPAEEVLRARIADRGPVGYDEVIELALYDPVGGFYATGGHAGRRGDFLTSPEVGPLFGVVVARALDHGWDAAGQPATFTVVEAGAGPGTLARSVLAAAPRCGTALQYVLVDRAAAQRQRHSDPPLPPTVTTRADLPAAGSPCIVLANELLDNLPFVLLERTERGWVEVRVDVEGNELVEVLGAPVEAVELDAPMGARVPVQAAAAQWVRDARHLAGPTGRVVAIDYASTTAAMAARPWLDWVRTYRRHQRGGHPLTHLGAQDITCEVAVDQLAPPSSDRSQANWLRAHGIDELVAEGRAVWQERAAIGDLQAMRARSRVTEADALLDEGGLGSFRVLEWDGR